MPERQLPLFPLNVVLFPGMRLPLHIFEERYKLMIGTCIVTDNTFGVSLIRSGQEVGGMAEVHPIGTTARIEHVERLPGGRMNLLTVGRERFRIVERFDDQPYAVARVELIEERPAPIPADLAERAASLFRRYLLANGLSAEQGEELRWPEEPAALSYLIAATLKVPSQQRQKLLETDSAASRLKKELAILQLECGAATPANAGTFSVN
jgi:Lon protease-like protein